MRGPSDGAGADGGRLYIGFFLWILLEGRVHLTILILSTVDLSLGIGECYKSYIFHLCVFQDGQTQAKTFRIIQSPYDLYLFS